MGKFDGVLITSDYDNTISYTEGALRSGRELPPVSPANRRAIEYFMGQGGIFSVATGRALPAFAPIAPAIPMNGPTILFNGAAIYDFAACRYLHTAFLPETVRPHLALLLERFPGLAMELYHDDNAIHAVNPNEVTRAHLHLTHQPTVAMTDLDHVPSPISKALLEGDQSLLDRVLDFLYGTDWAAGYEIVPSATCLVELTAHGANKGGMVEKLASLLGVARENVYCIGDHANDIPMLRYARIPFAPDNAIDAVHRVEGIHILPHCEKDAIAVMIDELDRLY